MDEHESSERLVLAENRIAALRDAIRRLLNYADYCKALDNTAEAVVNARAALADENPFLSPDEAAMFSATAKAPEA